MALELILGRSGAGKTEAIYQRILDARRENVPCILIVPDQSTYEAEQMLMRRMGGGLLDMEVLGFSRLGRRILDAAGGGTRMFLNESGKKMALRKVMLQVRGELTLFSTQTVRSGFVDKFMELIAVLKYGAVDVDKLEEAEKEVADGLLRQKLHDIAVLYRALNEFMADQYIDEQDALNLVVERMALAAFLRRSHVFIDAIPPYVYTAQTFALLSQLLRVCPHVCAALRECSSGDADESLFFQEHEVLRGWYSIARESGLTGSGVVTHWLPDGDTPRRNVPGAVAVLERRLFTYDQTPVENEDDRQGLVWLEAPNRKEETLAAAAHIDALLRDGARCRDIVVAVGDPSYVPLLRRALSHLPLFLDERRSLGSHGVVALSLAALQAAKHGFRAQDLLLLAKSGFSPLTDEQAEQFESYSLRYGVRYNVLSRPFIKCEKGDEALLAAAETARQTLAPPLLILQESLRSAGTARAYCAALFEYYSDIQLRERIEICCKQWEDTQEFDFAVEHAQVWRAVLSLLDQIATLLDGPMSLDEFFQVLEEGFLSGQIGVIPAQVDQITAGDVQRLSMREARHVLVLGCNEGCIPRSQSDDAILDDEDILALTRAGVNAFKSSKGAIMQEKQNVYGLFARAQSSLYVSWAGADSTGAALFPSSVADRVRALFPDCQRVYEPPTIFGVSQPREGFARSTADLRAVAEGREAPPDLPMAVRYFLDRPQWRRKMRRSIDAISAPGDSLRAQGVQALYDFSARTSASRLEMFNDCPFKHFVRYGLKPEIRRRFREEAADEGSFYHEVFDRFTKEILARGGDWNDLSQSGCDAAVNGVLDELEATHNLGVLQDNALSRAKARRMRRTAKRTVWSMVRQIQRGDFEPLASELIIGGENGDGEILPPLTLTLRDGREIELVGKVDRLDRYTDGKETYIRVVDYKTGSNTFSFSELYYGIKLQLPLYCRAVRKLGKVAGMFYLHIQDAIADEKSLETEAVEDVELKQYRLAGIMVCEEPLARAMDREGQGYSLIIPAQFTQSGLSRRKDDKLLSMDQMEVLLEYAQEKAAESAQRILEGATQCAPIKIGQASTCDRCDYAAVCRYEARREGKFRALRPLKAEAFFSEIEGERDEGE